MHTSIRTIYWEHNTVFILDQNALPWNEVHRACTRHEDVVESIKNLTIRGAPAIGVAAAMGIALGALSLSPESPEDFMRSFFSICEDFARTRPTARNLFWAIERMKHCVTRSVLTGDYSSQRIKDSLVKEALAIYEEDISINRRIGAHGRVLIQDGDTILTHCNAGALATAGYGTALGVIRAAVEEGKKIHVFVDETRPVLQGARLTAWELRKEKIPYTLIADSMAGFLMKQGKIHKVIVGADRIAANGDTANKIGTYSLAVLAREHGIPFYVVAPWSTIDRTLPSGDGIPIEERDSREITQIRGINIAPEGSTAYNPAFDVTPHRYITAIVTEDGIITPPFHGTL